jgi:anaerobic selenocysteine-containing dehydrogenase
MVDVTDPKPTKKAASRRDFLKAGLLGGAAVAASAGAARASGDPLITEIQDWNRYLGEGVDVAPYGKPVGVRSQCRAPQCAMADRRSGFLDQFHAAA